MLVDRELGTALQSQTDPRQRARERLRGRDSQRADGVCAGCCRELKDEYASRRQDRDQHRDTAGRLD
jgi:hypothetical protein